MKDIKAIYNECVQEMNAIGLYPAEVSLKVNTRAISRWGRTNRKTSFGKTMWEVELASVLLDDNTPIKAAKSTMFHELGHTLPNCFNHGVNWVNDMNKINAVYGYQISRTDANNSGDKSGVRLEKKANWTVTCMDCKREYKYQRKGGVIKALENGEQCTCPCGSHNFTVKHN